MQAGGGYQRSQNWSKALEAAKRSRNERFGPNQDWTQFLTQIFISFLTHFRARFLTRFFLFNFGLDFFLLNLGPNTTNFEFK